VSYAGSVQIPIQWDFLWRDSISKQITGYSLLGLCLLTLGFSLHKRWSYLRQLGQFDWWRLMHIIIGCMTLVFLALHTGFRFGSNLNFALMVVFCTLVLVGALSSLVIALEHILDIRLGRALRAKSTWFHILAFWPLPSLLLFHVMKSYFF
jgi:nitrite reductase (NADH) large subunit